MTRSAGFVSKCPADREHLLLAARELRAAVPLALREAREEVVHAVDRPALPSAAIADHAQVLVDGERREEPPALGHVPDPELRDPVGRTGRRAPGRRSGSTRRPARAACRGSRCRGSSCPCRCDRRSTSRRLDLERDVLERLRRPVEGAQALDPERTCSASQPCTAATEVEVVHRLVRADLRPACPRRSPRRRASSSPSARRSARRPCRARSGSA